VTQVSLINGTVIARASDSRHQSALRVSLGTETVLASTLTRRGAVAEACQIGGRSERSEHGNRFLHFIRRPNQGAGADCNADNGSDVPCLGHQHHVGGKRRNYRFFETATGHIATPRRICSIRIERNHCGNSSERRDLERLINSPVYERRRIREENRRNNSDRLHPATCRWRVMSFTLIHTTIIGNVTEVRFYDDTIEKIRLGHPEVPIELPSILDAASRAIVNPSWVEKSHSNTYVYVDAGSTNASGDPLRVPIRLVSGTSGRVASVYFATSTALASIVWRKS